MSGGDRAQLLDIRSASNERFRGWLDLVRSARERQSRRLTLIEGEHLLKAWLDAGGARLSEAIIPRRSSARAEWIALCERAAHCTVILEDSLFDRLSQVEHGPGPLSVIPIPDCSMPARLDVDALYLDGIQDPGNAGTVLRSAAAFGVSLIMSSPGSVGLWSPKVVRAAMGAHFVLQICEGVAARALLGLQGTAPITAADPRSEHALDEIDLTPPRVWVFGAEGPGVSPELLNSSELVKLQIPHSPAIESLNVGVAASICLHEQFRQRRAAQRA
jgi:TrmH family RNA methyltransferase